MIDLQTVGLTEDAATDAIKTVTLEVPEFFLARYGRDEQNQPIVVQEFQSEVIAAFLDPLIRKLLIMLPAAHGKTTLTRLLCALLIARDPNVRIMHIMNNATDAEQNLAALERSLDNPDSLLVQEHGPFKSARDWKASQFSVAKKTNLEDKEPTYAAYGMGSNVIGHRADYVIGDDMISLENSGPGVSQMQRDRIAEWFRTSVKNVAEPAGKVIVIGTAWDHRDLYSELQKPHSGFKVIKMPAIIDEDEQKVLWKERFSYQHLVELREEDFSSFSKRYQLIALDEWQVRFKPTSLEACRDTERKWGEITQDMKDRGETQVLVCFDPSNARRGSVNRSAKWCGVCVLACNPKAPEPRRYHVLEIWHTRALPEEQVGLLASLHRRYTSRAIVIEANGLNQWLMNIAAMRDLRASGAPIRDFWTSGEKKVDPDLGIDTLVGPIDSWNIRFPYADERSRREVDDFFANELMFYPQSALTDRLMALWFGVHTARTMGGSRLRTIRRTLPFWAGGPRPVSKPTWGKAAGG